MMQPQLPMLYHASYLQEVSFQLDNSLVEILGTSVIFTILPTILPAILPTVLPTACCHSSTARTNQYCSKYYKHVSGRQVTSGQVDTDNQDITDDAQIGRSVAGRQVSPGVPRTQLYGDPRHD